MTQDAKGIMAMRRVFWAKFRGQITLAEMQEAVKDIMSKQLVLPEVKNETHRLRE